MPVYVDPLADWGWKLGRSCHMIADTNEELHEMASKIGLKRSWFQTAIEPHYDLTESKRDLAIKHGAIPITFRQLSEKLNKWRRRAVSMLKKLQTEDLKQAYRQYLYR